MAWTYEQRSGKLSHDGEPIDTGYAGKGSGFNNPAEQSIKDAGPIPQGTYDIGPPRADGGHMGPFVLPLTPRPDNTMFGRDAFFMHGDKVGGPPHTASNGCIIMKRGTRNDVAGSGDATLVVVAG